MRKIFLLLLIGLPFAINAQITLELKGTINRKISSDLVEGESVELIQIRKDQYGNYKAQIQYNGKEELVELSKLDRISFNPLNLREFW